MVLEISEARVLCETKLKAPLNGHVRELISTLVSYYQEVLDGEIGVDEARDWYLRASEAFDTYRMRGDPVARHLGALQHTYAYCEERLRDAMHQLDDSDD